MGTALQQIFLMETLANHPLLHLYWCFLDSLGHSCHCGGPSLLLAACQKHGFGKWTGPVSAADRCELAQLKSPVKCSIFKQVSVSPFFFFCCWKTPAACSCYYSICPWTICSQQTNCLQIICLIQDTSLKGVSTGRSGI